MLNTIGPTAEESEAPSSCNPISIQWFGIPAQTEKSSKKAVDFRTDCNNQEAFYWSSTGWHKVLWDTLNTIRPTPEA